MIKPRNMAIMGIVAIVGITGAVLHYHIRTTGLHAGQWVLAMFPELVRNREYAVTEYGRLKHFDIVGCGEVISYGKPDRGWEILALCDVNATFDRAYVEVRIILKENGQSWMIREFIMKSLL